MTGDLFDTLSHQMTDLADRMAVSVVAVHGGSGPTSSAVVWRPDLVVAPEDRLDGDDRIPSVVDPGEARCPQPYRGRHAGCPTWIGDAESTPERHPRDAPGNWDIDTRCIDCTASRTVAPGLIVARGGQSVFARQPATIEERLQA